MKGLFLIGHLLHNGCQPIYFKRKFTLFSFLILFLSALSPLGAQEIPQPVPPSPAVAAIEKYGIIPTTYYTGLPNVSIPIYTLSSKSISVPISISYHAQGIKVNDISSETGLGWSLNAGGYLTRYQNGHEDGVGDSGFASEVELETFLEENVDEDGSINESIYCGNSRDNDIDIYSFSTPTGGGKFFYDNNDNIRFLPAANYSVLKGNVIGNTLEGYIIRDVNGIDHIYETIETQEQMFTGGSLGCKQPNGVSETSKLSRMTSFDGGEVTFSYDTVQYSYLTSYNETKVIPDNPDLSVSDSDSWNGVDVTDGRRLKQITTKEGYTVDFEYTGNGPGKLTRVSISFQGVEFKWFDFTYGSYTNGNGNVPNSIPSGHYSARHKLLSVEESGKGTYEFEYDNKALPPRFSYAQDYWGYSNGEINNTTLIPDKSVEGDLFGVSFATGNRDASLEDAQAGVLKKIIYPTGGYTNFYYDLNRVAHPNINAGGCLVNYQTRSSVNDWTSVSGNCAEIVQDTVVVNIPSGSKEIKVYYNSTVDATSQIDCVHNEEMNVGIIYYGNNSAPFNGTSQVINIPNTFNGPLTINMSLSGLDGNGNPIATSVNVVWQEEIVNCSSGTGNTMNVGGLRLTKQIEYADAGQPIVKNYTYHSAKYQTPKFYSKRDGYYLSPHDGCYYLRSELIPVLTSNPVISSNTLFGGSVVYNRVVEYAGDVPGDCYLNEELEEECPEPFSKTEYIYDHVTDDIVIHPSYSIGMIIDNSHLRGKLKEMKQYFYDEVDSIFKIKSQLVNTYVTLNAYTHYGIDVRTVRAEYVPINGCGSIPAVYDYFVKPYETEWQRLTSEKTTNYFYDKDQQLSGSIITNKSYTYNSDLLPISIITERAGVSSKVDYTYGMSLFAKAIPTIVENYKDEFNSGFQLMSKQDITYAIVNSKWNLSNVTTTRGTDILSNTSVSYDSFNRPILVTDDITGISTAYTYATDSALYPSAKCENCFSVFTEGFEHHPDSFNDANAKTGEYIYNLADGPVTIVAPSYYEITYWKKSSLSSSWQKSTAATNSGGSFTISGTGYIDNVIVYPPGGIVTTFSVKPGVGITSMTDHNGKSTKYEYDEYGRLIMQLDDDRNILKAYQYNYKN